MGYTVHGVPKTPKNQELSVRETSLPRKSDSGKDCFVYFLKYCPRPYDIISIFSLSPKLSTTVKDPRLQMDSFYRYNAVILWPLFVVLHFRVSLRSICTYNLYVTRGLPTLTKFNESCFRPWAWHNEKFPRNSMFNSLVLFSVLPLVSKQYACFCPMWDRALMVHKYFEHT